MLLPPVSHGDAAGAADAGVWQVTAAGDLVVGVHHDHALLKPATNQETSLEVLQSCVRDSGFLAPVSGCPQALEKRE